MKKSATRTYTRQLVLMSLLVALEVICSRFLSIRTPIVTIGFGFVPLTIGAMLYGPLSAAIIAATADFIGAILVPIGPYYFGFTISAFLLGLIWGVFLHRKDLKIPHIIGASATTNILISALLNSYWLHQLGGTPIPVLFATRVPKSLLMIPVEVLVIWFANKVLKREDFRKLTAV